MHFRFRGQDTERSIRLHHSVIRFLLLVLLGCLLAPPMWAQVQARDAILVQYRHTRSFTEPGVTAVYSLNTDVADAQAVPGGYEIVGRAPGQANVVVVTITGVHTLLVTVPAPVSRRRQTSGLPSVPGQTVQYGQYQFLYNNNPDEITNVENLTEIEGVRTIHIQITNADLFQANGQTPIGFPLLSYQVSYPKRTLTLVDEMVDNSDLTLNGVLLRGIHYTTGAWEFHAGITSMTQFQDFLLPGNRYEVAGLSRSFRLSKHSSLKWNFYYFDTNTTVNYGAQTGGIGTVQYDLTLGHTLQASAEVGMGNGGAFSGKIEGGTATQRYNLNIHYLSPQIASLGMTLLHGRTASFNWTGKFGKKAQMQASGSDTKINLALERQQVDTASLQEVVNLQRHFGVTGGITASRFIETLPYSPTIISKGFLFGPQLQWKHVGGSFQYELLKNGGTTPDSHNYSTTLQAGMAAVSGSVYFDVQTETPVLAPVQSGNSSLQQMLQHESVTAMSPAQLAQFMRENSSLTSQGYTQPVTFGLATNRKQYGGMLNWTSRKAGRFSFNALINTSSGGNIAAMRLLDGGVTWTRKMGPNNVLNAGFSMFHTVAGGQASTQPVIQFSLQHQLYAIPRWILPVRHGVIQGYVFEDAAYEQSFSTGDQPLEGVLVYLDGHRSTHTNAAGHYMFRGVPYGMHRVEVDYRNKQVFFYTSSNPRSVMTGGTADFGVDIAQGRIFGKVINDAGQGLEVTLRITGAHISRQIDTAGDGTFTVDGLPDGVYTIHPEASTFPPGYPLSSLQDQKVHVTARNPGHVVFRLPAERSASGQVEFFDGSTGKKAPLAGAEVSIPGLHRTVHTDSQGRFLFRSLPAGNQSVIVRYDGKLFKQRVLLESGPDIESGLSFLIPHTFPKLAPPSAPAPAETSPAIPGNQLHRRYRPRANRYHLRSQRRERRLKMQ
ncbi:MAG TPA: hypothetical protein DGA22_05685 [Acidobacterium sp.]|uniref:Cna protein B-type domain protein n=1 Tax=Acidobacterium capsulatum (strain ATCC 51196 / DSM 11244 / BCRC 80197 / JCM 7670 / NBRC 15755 / NCIMB 13165 / 161) TaxID=240015 RepID=C1F4A5_ACIC5|nr:hypothetical protein ACP_1134 [Acidobacterium capsulatum ATCC 51196]HCT60358.1 hypothetical protein [Acidobacterium sp.]